MASSFWKVSGFAAFSLTHYPARCGFAAIQMLIRALSTSTSSTYIMVHFRHYVR